MGPNPPGPNWKQRSKAPWLLGGGAGRIPGSSLAVRSWGGVDEMHKGRRSRFGGGGGEWLTGIGLATAAVVGRWGTPVSVSDHGLPASMKRLASVAELGRSCWRIRWGQTVVGGGRHQWLLGVKKNAVLEEDVVAVLLVSVTGHAQGDDDSARSGSSGLAVRHHRPQRSGGGGEQRAWRTQCCTA
jgi:hypothetical protein